MGPQKKASAPYYASRPRCDLLLRAHSSPRSLSITYTRKYVIYYFASLIHVLSSSQSKNRMIKKPHVLGQARVRRCLRGGAAFSPFSHLTLYLSLFLSLSLSLSLSFTLTLYTEKKIFPGISVFWKAGSTNLISAVSDGTIELKQQESSSLKQLFVI